MWIATRLQGTDEDLVTLDEKDVTWNNRGEGKGSGETGKLTNTQKAPVCCMRGKKECSLEVERSSPTPRRHTGKKKK